jgi:MFS transporter, putative metabolite:H+ symporter
MREATTNPATTLGRRHVFAAIACAVALAVDMIEMAIGNAFSTVFIAAPYHMEPRALSVLLASVYLGAVSGAPGFGWISGRLGIRHCLVVALSWLGATSFLAAASPGMVWLGGFRFLSGLALGAIPPLLIAYLTQMAPPGRRGLLIFWVCGLAALAPPAALMTMRWLLPLQPLGIESWRWLLAAAGMLSLTAAWPFVRLPEAHAWQPGGSEDSGRSAAADSGRQPLREVGRRLTLMSVIYFLLPWAATGLPLLTGPILIFRGFDVRQALLYVALTTIGPTLASLLTGTFVDRVDRRVTLGGCAVTMVAAVVVFGLARSPTWVGGALVTFGIAAAIYVTALTMYAAEIFPPKIMTFATSIAWACNRGAAVIVPIALFAIVNPRDSFHSLLPVIAAMLVSLVLVSLGPRATMQGAAP